LAGRAFQNGSILKDKERTRLSLSEGGHSPSSPPGHWDLSVMWSPIALPPSPNGKGRAMIDRRRFKPAFTFKERLAQEMEQLRDQAKNMKPGVAFDQVMDRIRQNETASAMDDWLRSPVLAPT
jgi:hypothetical protein